MRRTPRTPAPRPLAALALATLICLTGAGCGSDTPSGTGAADTGGQKSSDRDQAVKFSACMRENGVSDFPDPDAKNDFDYGISVSDTVWTTAVKACKEFQPPGTLSADRSAAEQAAGLRLARCIRENGVTDFPDPVNGEPLIDTNKIPSTDRKGGMAVLNAAMKKCADVSEEATGQRP
jgi:hypothetical protein